MPTQELTTIEFVHGEDDTSTFVDYKGKLELVGKQRAANGLMMTATLRHGDKPGQWSSHLMSEAFLARVKRGSMNARKGDTVIVWLSHTPDSAGYSCPSPGDYSVNGYNLYGQTVRVDGHTLEAIAAQIETIRDENGNPVKATTHERYAQASQRYRDNMSY